MIIIIVIIMMFITAKIYHPAVNEVQNIDKTVRQMKRRRRKMIGKVWEQNLASSRNQ